MPLASTNAWAYRQSHPSYDGRGVLIGILDSGVDAAVPGLLTTSTGDRKILDLRDFSAEGRIALTAPSIRGDTITVGGVRLLGMQRVAGMVAPGTVLGGVLRERPLGDLPASDLNANGSNADTLAVVVGKAPDGWVLFADTDGDGSLANERPVRDFLAARETFGWSSGGRASPLAVAVNFSGTDTAPILDLFFDNSGHGTHVAGIAAGHTLYGVDGFDGVAPGAQLLGLKISNNAHGGISVTGAMVRAIDYAIRFARERRLPLVLNMSFGVGNEREGAARIDAILDSVLAANPEVLFATSAGNDGPGLSTMGFPGSADRALSVGATIPPAFTGAATGDVVAFFSSRGGEVAKPDILAPGIAFSTVPRWDTGSEDKSGTSMASPHVAGALALLLSGVVQEQRTWTAAQIKQAVRATGRPMAGAARPDQGAGLLDVVAADQVLRKLPAMAAVRTVVGGVPGGGVLRFVEPGRPRDTTIGVEIRGTLGGRVRLVSDAAWLVAPPTVQLTPPTTRFDVTVRGSSVRGAGVLNGVITGWATDSTIGPLFTVPATLASPFVIPDTGLLVRTSVAAGAAQRIMVPADSGRPFRVDVTTAAAGQEVLAFLHEPGGQPFRTENGRRGGPSPQVASYELDGREVATGIYEVIAVAPPAAGATVEMRVVRAPLALGAVRLRGDSIAASLTNPTAATVTGTAMFGLVGAERGVVFSQRGSAIRRIPVRIPSWARRMVVQMRMPREQWPAFTDLGLSVVDRDGSILGHDPMNYALGQVSIELDGTAGDRDAEVVLLPGLADPVAQPTWNAAISIRFYAESPVLVEIPAGAEFGVEPGATSSIRFPLGTIPWPLGDGFFPLAQLVVDVRGELWGNEVRLPVPTGPIMP